MRRPGLKEYLDACEHWFEMYEAFVECEGFRSWGGVICFQLPQDEHKNVGYHAIDCSYCQILRDSAGYIDCGGCLLSDVPCSDHKNSHWRAFNYNPSIITAFGMLLAILKRKPDDYRETDEWL